MVDFDDIDNWAHGLTSALRGHVSDFVAPKLAAARPKYVEDARDLLFKLSSRDEIVDVTIRWIRSIEIAGYHGTRLTDPEASSIGKLGLVPLEAEARRTRLVRALSNHTRWPVAELQIDAALDAHGRGVAGNRVGQVHLTLSKTGLIKGFNHYLTHGSEFDQHVAHALLGPEGKDLLTLDGKPRIIQVAVPGSLALKAAHPHFSSADLRQKGDIPNLVKEFLEFWSFKLAHPDFQFRSPGVDCGMVFRETIPAAWITKIETLIDNDVVRE